MIWYTIRNKQWKSSYELVIKRGWGNGYVAIPPTHPAYKMDYDTLMYHITVHGGITFAGFGDGTNAPKHWWVFGFDTNHYQDDPYSWPEEAVIAETKRLFSQLLEIELGEL